MAIADSLLPEFDQEMSNTRKTLERVPADRFAWKPHQKSMAMGDLATHLANIPAWTNHTLDGDSFDLSPPGAPPRRLEMVQSLDELLQRFDANTARARATIANTPDEDFHKTWSLLNGGKALMTLPKIAVLRGFVFSHIIHHRAQLGVYLRLNDIPVPSIYGPSADEETF